MLITRLNIKWVLDCADLSTSPCSTVFCSGIVSGPTLTFSLDLKYYLSGGAFKGHYGSSALLPHLIKACMPTRQHIAILHNNPDTHTSTYADDTAFISSLAADPITAFSKIQAHLQMTC